MSRTGPDSSPVACQRCVHYVVTWNPSRPYGCRAHGFSTRINPALAVYQSSGLRCQLFQPKPAPMPPPPRKPK